MDADCLATPRPYNIYHFLLHCFIFLKTFFSKKDKCKHVSSQLGKTKVSMHFFLSLSPFQNNFTSLSWKKNSTKGRWIYNTKNMQHFLEPHVEKDTWLTAFLNLPVEEEVTIKGGSKKIYMYIQCKLHLNNISNQCKK